MTVYQIRQAASMWLHGKDTAHMAAILGVPERAIWKRMDTIRREARTLGSRSAA